jgi:K+ transporter
MGHFGTRPIRLTWFIIVFPALVLNYFGQGALLLADPQATGHPFYAMVPAWAMIPTVLLATLSTMIITTMLFFVVARKRRQWPVAWAAPLAGLFLLVDVPFFTANISKILHGAWFPLVIGVVFFTLMLTWAKGRWTLAAKLRKTMPPVHQFIVDLANKIDGDGVFLTGSWNAVPVALAKNVKHNNVVHGRTILLHFQVEDVPRVPNLEKVQTEKLSGGFHRIRARYGFMENPTLDSVLTLARGRIWIWIRKQRAFISAVKTWSSPKHPP